MTRRCSRAAKNRCRRAARPEWLSARKRYLQGRLAHPEHVSDVCQTLAALAHPARPRQLAPFQSGVELGQARDEALGANSVVGGGPPGKSPKMGSDLLIAPRADMHHIEDVGAEPIGWHEIGPKSDWVARNRSWESPHGRPPGEIQRARVYCHSFARHSWMTTRTLLLSTFSIGILIGALVLWISRDRPEGARAEAAWAQAQQEHRDADPAQPSAGQFADHPAAELEIRRLQEELVRERELREQLMREIEALEERLFALQGERPESDAEVDAADRPSGEKKILTVMEEQLDRFDESLLKAQGLSATEIEWIQRRWEQTVMEKFVLADYRARGKKLPEGMGYHEINESVLEDLGEDGYDAMLFATNQPNRVVVSSVLETSPAGLAGLHPGDVVYSYDNVRVFRPMELENLTRVGKRGETVKIEVIGEDGLVSYWIERGPSGAHFGSAKGPPLRY